MGNCQALSIHEIFAPDSSGRKNSFNILCENIVCVPTYRFFGLDDFPFEDLLILSYKQKQEKHYLDRADKSFSFFVHKKHSKFRSIPINCI